jgi:hypothetical protein
MNWNYPNRLWHRRDLLEAIAATAIAAPAILRGETARTAHRIIKIGYVSPLTGPLAGLGEADRFILGQVRSALVQGLVKWRSHLPGRNYQQGQPIECQPSLGGPAGANSP